MKVSLNWVKLLVEINLPVEELVEKIGAQLGAVESVEYIGEKYKGIVIAKVASCQKHPNADKLRVCLIDDGDVTTDVPRDEHGLVQVVCGAPNVKEGMLVAWLPPGSIVPSTFNKDPLALEAREIRGVTSNGMIASARELGISDDHEGILELNPHDAKPGDDFAATYKLDDYIIDIENKMFTHRPDCFGMLGVAREIAGITGQTFSSPEWYTKEVTWKSPNSPLPLAVKNELPELVPRFMAVAVNVAHNGPSPLWLQTYLSRIGLRPINMLVDVTNYVMLLSAQPMHAYDYHKVATLSHGDIPTLVIRQPKAGESLALLNGKTIEPRPETIMIATDKSLIGMGGAMGGSETEVDANTTTAILECANFDMYAVRRAAMAHGLFTDAVTRFNKGQSAWQCDRVLGYALAMLERFEAGTWASEVTDSKFTLKENPSVPVSAGFINARLGTDLTTEKIADLLRNVEFEVKTDRSEHQTINDTLLITAPFWRTDIEIAEDVVEEVGRLYGYDKLPLELPKRDLTPAKKDEPLELKSRIRDVLSNAGANEVLAYSFAHGNLLDKVGQDKKLAFEIANALSPDLQYYRMSLTPSLLEKIHPNIKAGHDEFAIYEIGKVHIKGENSKDEPEVPQEFQRLAFIFAAEKKTSRQYGGSAYYQARKYLMVLLEAFGVASKVDFVPLSPESYIGATETKISQYEESRAATVRLGNMVVGEIGEYKSSVLSSLKLPDFCAGFEIDLSTLLQHSQNKYVPLPRFPRVEQDISLKVPVNLPYGELFDFVWQNLEKLKPVETLASLTPIDIYQREDDKQHKQITLRLSIASYERTMTAEEVNNLLDRVAHAAKDKFGAIRI